MAITQKYAYGIKSIKFGEPKSDGTMQNNLTQWAETVRGSLTITEDEATKYEPRVEEDAAPVESITVEVGALTVRWRAYDLTPALMKVVRDGTAGTGATMGTYTAPTGVVNKELALQVNCEGGVKFEIPRASVNVRFDGGVSLDSLLEVEVVARAVDPGGEDNPPWTYTLGTGS